MRNRIEQLDRKIVAIMMSGLAILLSASNSTAAIDAMELQKQSLLNESQDTQVPLQDLVRAEAALALTQMHQKGIQGDASEAGSRSHERRNEVRSIYGVGNQLYTELLLSSKAYLFMSGQARPIQGPDHQWRLQRIQPPCIHLKHQGSQTVLCMGAALE